MSFFERIIPVRSLSIPQSWNNVVFLDTTLVATDIHYLTFLHLPKTSPESNKIISRILIPKIINYLLIPLPPCISQSLQSPDHNKSIKSTIITHAEQPKHHNQRKQNPTFQAVYIIFLSLGNCSVQRSSLSC